MKISFREKNLFLKEKHAKIEILNLDLGIKDKKEGKKYKYNFRCKNSSKKSLIKSSLSKKIICQILLLIKQKNIEKVINLSSIHAFYTPRLS